MKISAVKYIILASLLVPIKLFALSQSVSITCDNNEFKENETVGCVLKGYTDKTISSLEGKLSSDSSLKISNIKLSNSWQGIEDSFFELYTDEDVLENFDIVSFNISSTQNGTFKIYVKDIVFYDELFEEDTVNDYEFSFTVLPISTSNSDTNEVFETSDIEEINNVPNTKFNSNIYIYCVGIFVIISIILAIILIISKLNKKEEKNEI